jgi:hypothetical protein
MRDCPPSARFLNGRNSPREILDKTEPGGMLSAGGGAQRWPPNAEIIAQRTRIGERITTENITLKQRVRQLTTDNRTLGERRPELTAPRHPTPTGAGLRWFEPNTCHTSSQVRAGDAELRHRLSASERAVTETSGCRLWAIRGPDPRLAISAAGRTRWHLSWVNTKPGTRQVHAGTIWGTWCCGPGESRGPQGTDAWRTDRGGYRRCGTPLAIGARGRHEGHRRPGQPRFSS